MCVNVFVQCLYVMYVCICVCTFFNDECSAGLLANIEANIADDEKSELDKQQKVDLEKTITDCETNKVRKIV